jgi:O-succinylbenzoic acid--CoA ligase
MSPRVPMADGWLPDWLHQRARMCPDRLALIAGDGSDRWTFSSLDSHVTQTVNYLVALGLGADDRVALLMSNSRTFVTLVHALSRLGAVLVPLNTRLAPAEIGWQLRDVGARWLIHDQVNDLAARTAARDAGRPALQLLLVNENSLASLPTQASTPGSVRFRLDAPHSILYTSGTTGHPKGAVLTYGNHWWSAIGSALNLGLSPDDRWLACLPLFHVGGLAILLRSVIYGNTAILHESFDPNAVNKTIDEEQVTVISVVSVMLRRMLEARGDRPYPGSLRCVLLGGGPASPELLEACVRHGVPVVQTYGLTEAASQVATLSPADARRKSGSAGLALLPTEVSVARDNVDALAGEIGEIVVRGPTITSGYVDNPEATAQALRDGWLHTGDLGYLDEEGFLYVLDRRDDLIISGGENVYPAEVEAVLLSHPAVDEAGVTGLPDQRWGQVPAAFIKVSQGLALTEGELEAYCAARLARYKVPAYFRFVESLPRNAAGKLLRRELRELDSRPGATE